MKISLGPMTMRGYSILLALTTTAAMLLPHPMVKVEEDSHASSALEAIRRVAPEALRDIFLDDHSGALHRPDISLPKSTAESATMGGGMASISVGLPHSERPVTADEPVQRGIQVFDNEDGSSTVAVAHARGVQLLTVISHAEAPREYEYSLGGSVEQVRIRKDGSASLHDKYGVEIGRVAPPWAKDASGANLSTRYVVDGAKLSQLVDFDENTTFPIVADPWLGYKLVESVEWQGTTLVVTPSDAVLAGLVAPPHGTPMWMEITSLASINSAQTYSQFRCYWNTVRLKQPDRSTWTFSKAVPMKTDVDLEASGCM